ncbi:hypothetical protein J2S11_000667 [Bacillus horti]|uniref:Transposase n=1 Tax=Caldalkalibacillus horti TaxID=77523 RepID=A0ABT9VUU8_9BACI|nr:hypothetical protein [Bacillus horti]
MKVDGLQLYPELSERFSVRKKGANWVYAYRHSCRLHRWRCKTN